MDERSVKLKAGCKLSEDSSAEGRSLQAAHQLQDKAKKRLIQICSLRPNLGFYPF